MLGDASLQIKSGVQWGLFAAAIMHSAPERHHDAFLPGAMSLAVPGGLRDDRDRARVRRL